MKNGESVVPMEVGRGFRIEDNYIKVHYPDADDPAELLEAVSSEKFRRSIEEPQKCLGWNCGMPTHYCDCCPLKEHPLQ